MRLERRPQRRLSNFLNQKQHSPTWNHQPNPRIARGEKISFVHIIILVWIMRQNVIGIPGIAVIVITNQQKSRSGLANL